MQAFLIILVVLLALVAAFAVQNPGIILVHFLGLTAYTSLLVVIIASFGVGILAAVLGGAPAWWRKRRRIRELEAEVSSLRIRLEEASRPGDRRPEERPPAAPSPAPEIPKATP